MHAPLQNRLQLQLFLTLLAALSVATLSVLLITEAIRSTESVLIGETNRTVSSAIRELAQQYRYRVSSDSGWDSLPKQAKDVSLRGITQTVLRAYPGVEGGFYVDSDFSGICFSDARHRHAEDRSSQRGTELDSFRREAKPSKSDGGGAGVPRRPGSFGD